MTDRQRRRRTHKPGALTTTSKATTNEEDFILKEKYDSSLREEYNKKKEIKTFRARRGVVLNKHNEDEEEATPHCGDFDQQYKISQSPLL
jgi:hypothetical protein